MKNMNNRGLTFVEILVTLAIVGILSVALGFQFAGWKARYNIEKTTRDLYSSLTDARTRAIQTSRAYFFDISPNGRLYRVTDDDSDGTARVANGDGIFRGPVAGWAARYAADWTAIQASQPLNWGAVAVTTDTTINTLSRRIELPNNTATLAGLLSARDVAPGSGNSFVLGFDKRGIIRNMRGLPAAITNIENANAFPPSVPAPGSELSICIFTDYDNNKISDYDPDYDCINIIDTKISMGKLTTQNTNGGTCDAANCISK